MSEKIVNQKSKNKSIFSEPWRLLPFMAFFLPVWLTFGRALFGSAGWFTIFFAVMFAPCLFVIFMVLYILIKKFYVENLFVGIWRVTLPILYWSIFIFGIFIVDAGDTSQQGSIFTIITGKLTGQDTTYFTNYHWFSNICADAFLITSLIFLLIIFIQVVICIVVNIKSRQKINQIYNEDHNTDANPAPIVNLELQIDKSATSLPLKPSFKYSNLLIQLLVILIVISSSYVVFTIQKHNYDLVIQKKYPQNPQSNSIDYPIIVYDKTAGINLDLRKVSADSCQPEDFYSEASTYYKIKQAGTSSELYKIKGFRDDYAGGVMMINGWDKESEDKITLPSPYDVNIYKFGCDDNTFSYAIEITKNGTFYSRFTHITHFSFSKDGKNLYMVSKINYENSWIMSTELFDVGTKAGISFSKDNCMSETSGFWQGDKLITYVKDISGTNNKTNICIWNNSGEIISRLSTNSYWNPADGYYLAEQIGLLPNEPGTFYAYTSKDEKTCSLFLADISKENTHKSIDILTKKDYPKADHCISPSVEFDFSGSYYNHGEIKYRIEKNTDSLGEMVWDNWQIIQIK